MGRIITPDGMVPGQDGKPDRPPTLQERVELALEHWQFKRKDEAFATALNAIAYLSNGLAGLAKLSDRNQKDCFDLRKTVNDLNERLKRIEVFLVLDPPAPPPPSPPSP